jgi:hypothetical protein
MRTEQTSRGLIVCIALLGYSLIAACTPQSGPSTPPQTLNLPTHKKAFVFGNAPNDVVAHGDKALGENHE